MERGDSRRPGIRNTDSAEDPKKSKKTWYDVTGFFERKGGPGPRGRERTTPVRFSAKNALNSPRTDRGICSEAMATKSGGPSSGVASRFN